MRVLKNPRSVLSDIKAEIKLNKEDTKSRVELVENVNTIKIALINVRVPMSVITLNRSSVNPSLNLYSNQVVVTLL